MNLRQLEIFRAVMLTGSTNAAARELSVSQPAVSNMIKHIEDNLKLELFKRKGGRLEPTEDAKALYGEIEPLFLFYRSIEQKIEDIRNRRTGNLRVAATSTCANSCVSGAVKRLIDNHPGVQVSLDVQRTEAVLEQVLHNVADVGITLSVSEHPAINSIPLHLGHMVCIVPKGHPLAELEVIRPFDLADVPFIAMEEGSGPLGNLITNAFSAAGEDMRWSIETGFCTTACALVNAGAGCALVDEFALHSGTYPNIVAKPFRPDIPLTIFAFTSKERPSSWIMEAFIKHMDASRVDLSLNSADGAHAHT